jgi:hypothetical protein
MLEAIKIVTPDVGQLTDNELQNFLFVRDIRYEVICNRTLQ